MCVILGLVVERQWSISGRPSPRAPHTFGGGITCEGAGDLASLSFDYGSEQVGKNLELTRRRKLEGGLTVPGALGLKDNSELAASDPLRWPYWFLVLIQKAEALGEQLLYRCKQ